MSSQSLHQEATGIVVGGQRFKNVTEACRARGLNSKKIQERIRCGWSIEEALEVVKRQLPSQQYRARKMAFAAQQGLALSSVESRLSVRRNRFRKWLHLPFHTSKRHTNAVMVTDKNNVTYSSMKDAARELKVHRYNLPKQGVKMQPIEKYCFEKEMKISPDTLMLLISHPNLTDKPDLFRPQGHRILLDNQVPLSMRFSPLQLGQYAVEMSIGDINLMRVRLTNKPELLPDSMILQRSNDLSTDEENARYALLNACARKDWDAFVAGFEAYTV